MRGKVSLYKYRGRWLDCNQLYAMASERGITKSSFQARLANKKWTVAEAVEVPKGGESKAGKANRLGRMKRQGQARSLSLWREIACLDCKAKPGESCISKKSGKPLSNPHARRRRLAGKARQNDRHLVDSGWKARAQAIRQEHLDAVEELRQLTEKVLPLAADRYTQKAISERLGITEDAVALALGTGHHSNKGTPVALTFRFAPTIRPRYQREGHGEMCLPSSSSPCGGGWRMGWQPREEDGHCGLDHSRIAEDDAGFVELD